MVINGQKKESRCKEENCVKQFVMIGVFERASEVSLREVSMSGSRLDFL